MEEQSIKKESQNLGVNIIKLLRDSVIQGTNAYVIAGLLEAELSEVEATLLLLRQAGIMTVIAYPTLAASPLNRYDLETEFRALLIPTVSKTGKARRKRRTARSKENQIENQ
jgi:hypothetical protein